MKPLKICIKEYVSGKEPKVKKYHTFIVSPYVMKVFKPVCIWSTNMPNAPGNCAITLLTDDGQFT